MPVAIALAWIFGKNPSGDGLLARVGSTRRKRVAVAFAPTLFVAAALVAALAPRFAASGKIDPSVSVPFFRDDSPKGDLAYLARGLSEELARTLHLTPGMRVMGRPDSAAVIIEGAVGRWQDSLRVTATLVRNGDKRFLGLFEEKRAFGDGAAVDVFAMQKALSQAIASDLVPRMRDGQAKGSVPVNDPDPVAYDLYLRARFARDSESDLRKADSLLRASVAADPSFTRARRDLARLRSSAP